MRTAMVRAAVAAARTPMTAMRTMTPRRSMATGEWGRRA